MWRLGWWGLVVLVWACALCMGFFFCPFIVSTSNSSEIFGESLRRVEFPPALKLWAGRRHWLGRVFYLVGVWYNVRCACELCRSAGIRWLSCERPCRAVRRVRFVILGWQHRCRRWKSLCFRSMYEDRTANIDPRLNWIKRVSRICMQSPLWSMQSKGQLFRHYWKFVYTLTEE